MNVITNLTNIKFSHDVLRLLEKGPNYALSQKIPNQSDILATFENFFNFLDGFEFNTNFSSFSKDHFRTKLKCLALDYVKHSKGIKLPKWQNIAIKKLKAHKNIIISKPNKGNGIVIMYKEHYYAKMDEILSDTSKFKALSEDTTTKIENRLIRRLRDLFNSGQISDDFYKKVRPTGSVPGVMYGLPKVHKDGTPLLPILHTIGTPCYLLAKQLCDILSPLCQSSRRLTDSFSFVKQVNSLSFTFPVTMCSFDVSSLFTNVPLDETISIAIDRLFAEGHDTMGMSKDTLSYLLCTAAKDCCFVFNGHFYCQLDGVAMGSPLGPVLADIFMIHFEECFVSNWLKDRICAFFRYVDDTFVVFRNPLDIDLFLQHINSCHSNISFTFELESDDTIPFLDTSIHKFFNLGESQFYTTSYKKPTFTGLYTRFDSFCPERFKSNLVYILLLRAYNICSRRSDFWKEVSTIKEWLLQNGYPIPFIKGIIHSFHQRVMISPEAVVPHVEKKKLFLSLPYLGVFSKNFKYELTHLISECYPQVQILCVFNSYKLFKFFPFKDVIDKLKRSNVIYRIDCKQCNVFYVGKTERRLSDRVKEHMGALHKHYLRSAAADHCHSSGHEMDWANICVIDSNCNRSSLLVKETLAIKQLKPPLNNTESSIPLKLFT